MTRLTVSAVSSTGKGFKADDGEWYNRAKGATFVDFKSLNKGDVVDTDADGKWVKSFSVVNGGQPSTQSHETGNKKAENNNFRDPAVIVRQEAIKAVLDSPAVAELYKTMDKSQAVAEMKVLIEQMVDYSLTGEFKGMI